MKKIMILVLVFGTTFGFSQQREQRNEARKAMLQERQNLTAEQKAELSTKKLALQLDLTEAQQKSVYQVQLEMAKTREINMKDRKANADKTDFYHKANTRLDHQMAHQEKMKAILSEKQYALWKENMGKRKRGKAKGIRNNN
ncbi:MAG: hypothetical protein COZ75_07665 [Flavobacteriaceae bacterium CG_4_8_14_3_um_filter_34_10]|nr:hypothetical protein [Flavobacteriia bacterium]OIP51852.1 MAG: hypothetical protein AUK33_02885 [Flavobacteriaceae bacterium CG2_30_34_30]PIQ17680.1 MAG: hypothetical protein COW66_10565 [Flavobacteriaceae bacterium CG18_big_fil_WC_8_21_14_2_50_34_36]PIV51385.1 MAG: hypothetical protein COS19_01255 [Flavobacteriaceae bacterium CG02_land_8_20_14_3_00_34_13]PIX09272.1 MAG: hypothetical protein COZ75_07665 [Flavobacteriaceae bacterium CG_4_8_14_3_um_filter_34_10]PIZ08384.1 MAG: hypothetical pr